MTSSEAEIRAVVDERIAAVKAKNAQSLADRIADDVVVFDVLPPLNTRGKDANASKTEAWFAGYASEIGYDIEQLEIAADHDVAFCSFLYHVFGALKSGDQVSMWVRATLGLRRDGDRWQIVHDHESVPFDPESGRALIDLTPERPATGS